MAVPRSGDSNQHSSNPRNSNQRSSNQRNPDRQIEQRESLHVTSPDTRKPRAFRPQRPLWLTLMLWTQRGSSLVTLVLGAAILITYGWTVYIQQQWGQQFDQLESMKKQERQLVSANEVLKNDIAEQAEKPTVGLLLPDPGNAIFLTPAPQRPAVKASPTPVKEPAPTRPLGY